MLIFIVFKCMIWILITIYKCFIRIVEKVINYNKFKKHYVYYIIYILFKDIIFIDIIIIFIFINMSNLYFVIFEFISAYYKIIYIWHIVYNSLIWDKNNCFKFKKNFIINFIIIFNSNIKFNNYYFKIIYIIYKL